MAPAQAHARRRAPSARPTNGRVPPRPATRMRAGALAVERPAFGHAHVRVSARLASAAPVALVLAGVALAASGLLTFAGTVVCGVLAACGAAVVLGNLRFGSMARTLRALDARPADPAREARLVNLTESLCLGFGLAAPGVVVLDNPAPNALTLGRSARSATLVVTSGALDLFDRMELEAVIAHELAHLKRGDTAAAARVMRAFGFVSVLSPAAARLAERGVDADREARADLAAMSVTRYPPALADALEALAGAATVQPPLAPAVARLTAWQWCAPFDHRPPGRALPGELDLSLRIAALREL